MELSEKPTEPIERYPLMRDIAGTSDIKSSLEEIVTNISNSHIFRMLGVEPVKSYMFEGPPGTGKTFAVEAIQNELEEMEISTELKTYNIGTHGTAYINMGARILQKFFNDGREQSLEGKTILYWFDEADVIMSKRGGMHNKEDDKLLNCLMKNLQEINSKPTDEYVFFATNFKDQIDKASMRSGRIDKILHFRKPTQDDLIDAYTKEIDKIKRHYDKYFKGASEHIIGDIAYDVLAETSNGFNYPDVTEVVRRSVRSIGHEIIKSEETVPQLPQLNTKRLTDNITKLSSERYPNKGTKVGFQ